MIPSRRAHSGPSPTVRKGSWSDAPRRTVKRSAAPSSARPGSKRMARPSVFSLG